MKCLVILPAFLMLGLSYAPPEKFSAVDLKSHTNQKLKENFGSGAEGNNLAGLLSGGKTFEGVNFKIDDGVIQLASRLIQKKQPNKVEGIKVDKACVKIHILHATCYGNGQNIGQEGMEGDPLWVKDGTKIAEYKIHYDDGTTAAIPVVYGEDVRDWFYTDKSKAVTRGKVAWKGENDRAKEIGSKIRLYLTTWENPHPNKKIATIDYAKTDDGPAGPFCVAITLEAK
jgi:hypothetical protein